MNMKTSCNHRALLAGMLISLAVNVPAIADDIEIYVGGNLTAAAAPNVLFVVDTSGSMRSEVTTQTAYDPAFDYSTLSGACSDFTANRIYWSTGTANTSCGGDGGDDDDDDDDWGGGGSDQWFDVAYFKCDAATNPLFNQTGFYQDRVQRYSSRAWRDLTTSSTYKQRNVECESDFAIHGIDAASTALWPATDSGDNATGGWTTNANSSDVINWAGETSYTLYTGNFLNYLRAGQTITRTRLEIVQEVVANVIDSVNGINIGLMRFDTNKNGGMVAYAMEPIETARTGFKDALDDFTATGGTPLTEALYEGMLYYRGDAVDWGDSSSPYRSVAASRDPGNSNYYLSPVEYQCQRNSIILLSDGAPNGDTSSDSDIQGMPNYASATGVTNCPHPSSHESSDGSSTDGRCLDQLAQYMANEDQRPTGLADDQFVQTYTIGFQLDHPLLRSTALLGNGLYFTADDTTGLTNAFTAIINEVLSTNATFTSPAVSVNSFSRATHRNELYFTVFRPSGTPHWDGNLKKYQIGFITNSDGTLVPQVQDSAGAPAVDPVTGYFRDTAQSFWSNTADGEEVAMGGTAHELTTARKVYTYTGSGLPTNIGLATAANTVHESNNAITDAMLGMASGATNPSRTELLQWARGVDIDGVYGTPGGARTQVGDPLHSQARVVQYGGTDANPDLTVFYSTNDGYLSAVHESDGTEAFSFVPKELLGNLLTLYGNNAASLRPYGLDGSVVTWTNDVGNDGTITPGTDHVFVYVGMRRGGFNYYALDATDRSAPVLKWMITNDTDNDGTPDGDFAELGQTWSDPVIKRIKWNGSERIALIFGGGYDDLQDDNNSAADDSMGRAVYVVDANTGARLWWAGPVGSGANLELANLTNAVPAPIATIDIDGNDVVDRLYFGDTRAQLWRIDINEGNSGATNFATGGRIAAFGANSPAGNRRFYHAMDVALIAPTGEIPYLALVLGSGYRAHPLNTTIQDRIYMVKDFDVFSSPTSYTTLTQSDLFDATSNVIAEGTSTQQAAARAALNTANGWYINLQDPSTNAWLGEKVLAQPLIADNIAVVPAFIPNDMSGSGPEDCSPNDGGGFLYYLNIADATPVANFDSVGSDTDLTRSDRTHRLTRGGLTPSPNLIIADDGTGGITPVLCAGTECGTPPFADAPIKTHWFEY